MIAMLQAEDKHLILGGDGRCDSPGFSAKYGTYTLMELQHNVILYIELVQVSICNILNFTTLLYRAMNWEAAMPWKKKGLSEGFTFFKITT